MMSHFSSLSWAVLRRRQIIFLGPRPNNLGRRSIILGRRHTIFIPIKSINESIEHYLTHKFISQA